MNDKQRSRYKRIVTYVDPETYALFVAVLVAQGMTVSGWMRREIAAIVNKSKKGE